MIFGFGKSFFIQRKKDRKPASVARSWERIEAWFQTHAPELLSNLHAGASTEEIAAFEAAAGVQLPDPVRESYQIHNGQEEIATGMLIGEPLDTLERIGAGIQYSREYRKEYEESDAYSSLDEESTSYPVDAIRRLYFNPGWIPLGDWDGNCYGVDLDPGPNGVSGQVINFGRDEDHKYVLALSWAHFLEDIADELEAGSLEVRMSETEKGFAESFGRRGHNDQALHRFYREWSLAKLPKAFQNQKPAPRVAVFPGKEITGPLAEEARVVVEGFITAMSDYEQHWLRIRPIHKLGYHLVIEDEDGHRLEPLCMSKVKLPEALLETSSEAAPLSRMQMKVHVKEAVAGYRAILQQFCTPRKRSMDGALVQCFPPKYMKSRERVTQVRQVADDQLLVYTTPVRDSTSRYHLKQVDGRWLIDLRDETEDHAEFVKTSLLFGFSG